MFEALGWCWGGSNARVLWSSDGLGGGDGDGEMQSQTIWEVYRVASRFFWLIIPNGFHDDDHDSDR